MRCSLQKSATTTFCSLALVVLALAACGERDPRPQVFVAASLHRVVADIVDELGLEVRIGTAASSTLARRKLPRQSRELPPGDGPRWPAGWPVPKIR